MVSNYEVSCHIDVQCDYSRKGTHCLGNAASMIGHLAFATIPDDRLLSRMIYRRSQNMVSRRWSHEMVSQHGLTQMVSDNGLKTMVSENGLAELVSYNGLTELVSRSIS